MVVKTNSVTRLGQTINRLPVTGWNRRAGKAAVAIMAGASSKRADNADFLVVGNFVVRQDG